MDNGAASYRRYLEGDDEGMVELIRDYKDGLTLYLLGISGNIFAAEEAMEQTFYKLVVKKPGFSGKSSFKTWLYAIGRNAALDSMRRAKRISPVPVDEERLESEENEVENAYLLSEKRKTVHRALKKLNPDYRQVLYLIYFENMSGSEAAAVMKKNGKQIENLAARARASLRSELKKEGFDYEDL